MVKKEEGGADGNETLVLSKPGQRYATPTPGVAERIFYETLYAQRPDRYVCVCMCRAISRVCVRV